MSSVWSNIVSAFLNAFAPASNPLTSAASATVIAKITGGIECTVMDVA